MATSEWQATANCTPSCRGAYGGPLTMIKHNSDPLIHKRVRSSAKPSHYPLASSHCWLVSAALSTKPGSFASDVSQAWCTTASSPSRRETFQVASSASPQAEASKTALSLAILSARVAQAPATMTASHARVTSSRSVAMSAVSRAKHYAKKAEEGRLQGAQ
jgi:hypothetical protein